MALVYIEIIKGKQCAQNMKNFCVRCNNSYHIKGNPPPQEKQKQNKTPIPCMPSVITFTTESNILKNKI